MGLSRAAYIVARAHQRCATRPFANTQSVHSSTVAPQPPKNGAAEESAGFILPKDVNGTVTVHVDAVTFKGGLISDVRLNGELSRQPPHAPANRGAAVFRVLDGAGSPPSPEGGGEPIAQYSERCRT